MTTPSLRQQFNRRTLAVACDVLGDFTVEQAEKTAAEVGFGWVAAPTAPSIYDDLALAYEHSARTGDPLPISSENNQDTIYVHGSANIAMRFWHDVSHVRRGLTFQLVDELELALWHLSVLERHGFGSETLVWKLLRADLVGQAEVMAFARRFPLHQQRFVQGCISGGFDRGLLKEIRRRSDEEPRP